MVTYIVRCEIDDPAIAAEWARWLGETHLAEVLAAGAIAAELVRLDRPRLTFEARYRFESLAAFERYEREEAPRLRADGLRRFPLERGLRYERSIVEVLAVR